MKKLDKLDKIELIDIVHKAKCGKLKNLDTAGLTKEQLIEHLYNSKCPEVHNMIVEITELKDDLSQFIDKYIEAGKDLTVEQIYYEGMQETIMSVFFYDVWKNKRYDCVLHNSNQHNYYKFGFDFSFDRAPTEMSAVMKYIGDKIDICRLHKDIKIIAIPIFFKTSPISAHANAIIYRVDSNTFERFEPHGSRARFDYVSDEYEGIKNKIEGYSKQYHALRTEQREKPRKNKDYNEKAEKLIAMVKKLEIKAQYHKYKMNDTLDEHLSKYFTKVLPKLNKNFKGAKYITSDVVTSALYGIQHFEGKEIIQKYSLTREQYIERIGGFCVLWSIMYFDLVFRFPKATPAILNKALLDLLEKKGEFAFGELALGYLQGFKKHIDGFLGKTDYSDATKRKNLLKDLEHFIIMS